MSEEEKNTRFFRPKSSLGPAAQRLEDTPIRSVLRTRSALWFSGGFAVGLVASAVIIHAIGYRVLASPPLKGTATLARDAWERFPETRVPAMERAIRQRWRHTPTLEQRRVFHGDSSQQNIGSGNGNVGPN
jgi:hypothetical protein